MTRVMGFCRALVENVRLGPCSSFVTESAWPTWGIPSLPTYVLVWILSDSMDSGGRLVSHGGDFRSNEKVEMTLFALGQNGRGPHGAHLCFLPWLCLTWGGLEPFMGWPSNPDRSLLMLNEATAAS